MVLEQIKQLCTDRYGCDERDVTLAATVRELNLTRYELGEIASVLESIYGIAVPEEVLDEMEILEDLVGYVEDRM